MPTRNAAFIEPTRSTLAVPVALRRMRAAKQGDEDYACGLFAVLTAARKLGTMSARAGVTAILEGLEAVERARIEARLPRIGLFEKDLRALANAAGLAVYRPNTHDAGQF